MFKFVQIQAKPWKPYVEFVKVDMDKCQNVPNKYEIKDVPAFVFLRDGDDETTGFKRIIGENYEEQLNDFVGEKYCKITSNTDTDT